MPEIFWAVNYLPKVPCYIPALAKTRLVSPFTYYARQALIIGPNPPVINRPWYSNLNNRYFIQRNSGPLLLYAVNWDNHIGFCNTGDSRRMARTKMVSQIVEKAGGAFGGDRN
jgi:hypothetical protein